jgi:FtsP/CotA-like multicopper oxidase with cupredoxin domain
MSSEHTGNFFQRQAVTARDVLAGNEHVERIKEWGQKQLAFTVARAIADGRRYVVQFHTTYITRQEGTTLFYIYQADVFLADPVDAQVGELVYGPGLRYAVLPDMAQGYEFRRVSGGHWQRET